MMIRPLNPEALKPPRVATLPVAPPQVHCLELHGEHIAFDANSLVALHVDEATSRRLKQDSNALGGLVGSTARPQFRGFGPSPLRHLVLNVTHACNLACAYCFAAKYREPATMSVETARRALRLFRPPRSTAEQRQPLAVSFFGGEPLLAWDTVQEAIRAARARARVQGREARFHVTTNGTLLDDGKAAYLAQHSVGVLVSLDGPADLHDEARPRRDGGKSFGATLSALHALRQAGARRPTVRGTFTLAQPRLRERLEFYGSLIDAGLIAGFSLEPAFATEGCAAREDASLDEAALRREYHEAAQWYVDRLRAGKEPGFFHFRKLLGRLREADHRGTECGAGNGYLTVGPNGDIFACHRETGTRLGHVDTGIDEALRCAWCDNRLYHRAGCMTCWARHLCGGGCRQHAAELGRPLTEPDTAACAVMRIMCEECLWILTQVPSWPNDR